MIIIIIIMHGHRVPFPGSKSELWPGGHPVCPAMSTGWRLRPGTVIVEVAPSRSAGHDPSRSAGNDPSRNARKPKRKAPSTCGRSVRRRTSGSRCLGEEHFQDVCEMIDQQDMTADSEVKDEEDVEEP